jgi:hypothetical protein
MDMHAYMLVASWDVGAGNAHGPRQTVKRPVRRKEIKIREGDLVKCISVLEFF